MATDDDRDDSGAEHKELARVSFPSCARVSHPLMLKSRLPSSLQLKARLILLRDAVVRSEREHRLMWRFETGLFVRGKVYFVCGG